MLDMRGILRGECKNCDCEEFFATDLSKVICSYCGCLAPQHENKGIGEVSNVLFLN
jgi:hypothetical protein